jgi:hypothetical protein
MTNSQRRQLEEQRDRVANIVASVLTDADADLFNLTDEALDAGAGQAVIELAKLAAASIERHATNDGTTLEAELIASFVEAFGRGPSIIIR